MAQVVLPRIRIFSDSPGTGNFDEDQRAMGSFGIAELMLGGAVANGDAIDYVASYGDAFEHGQGTINSSGNIVRPTTTICSRHANGTINTSKVTFSSGMVS